MRVKHANVKKVPIKVIAHAARLSLERLFVDLRFMCAR
jgi:hypothetical protein